MPNIERERWDNALRRVALIERQAGSLKRRLLPRKFTFTKRSAWATPEGLAVLPVDQQHELPAHGHTRARVRAESVLIGKFDVQSEVRLRAFYPSRGLSIRYQAGGKLNGITRTMNAYNKVQRYAPELMPKIYEHGTILDGRGAYLIEETVEGETATRSQLQQLILPITQRLHKVHQGAGITDKSLDVVLGSRSRGLWDEFVETQNMSADLNQTVQELYDRNGLLEVSVTHGDLVNSNILVNGKDFVLVDWEWASVKPIAFDMAKMIINVHDIDGVLETMHTGLGGQLGSGNGHYTFREQVALALVQTLTFHKRQSVKAKKAKRLDALARQTKKRVRALENLLGV